MKRVAGDLKGDLTGRLPRGPFESNHLRIACVGAGPASLVVANDLAPLGYEVVIFERNHAPGGLMRSNIPSFRLPQSTLDEEIGAILDMGVELRLGAGVESLRALPDQGFDAVFVGSGAPKGHGTPAPRAHRHRSHPHRHHVARVHRIRALTSVGERVLIIGVGNTAMDCCRSSLRLGAKSVKVMARKPRGFFKASNGSSRTRKRRASRSSSTIRPKPFIVTNGTLTGMLFEKLEYDMQDGRILAERSVGEVTIPCDDVILAIGQENAFPWIERDLGVEFDK